MTKLKTLKDLKTVADLLWKVKAPLESGKTATLNYFIRIQELKQEAIKWVKLKGNCKWFPNCNLVCVDITIKDWMKFFNLTEEDIK